MGNAACGCNETEKHATEKQGELETSGLRAPGMMKMITPEVKDDEVQFVEGREEQDGTLYTG